MSAVRRHSIKVLEKKKEKEEYDGRFFGGLLGYWATGVLVLSSRFMVCQV
jgi:hypothetical protein